MNCLQPRCDGTLEVSHTYNAGTVKYARAVCKVCGFPHCLTTTAEPVNGRGDGAKAKATKHRAGVGS